MSVNTNAELSYSTDWAKFEVTSRGATVQKVPGQTYTDVTFTETTVMWQKPHTYVFKSGKVPFQIVNDGTAVNITISRGRDGKVLEDYKGQASATFGGHTYTNDENYSIYSGVQTFTDCPVDKKTPPMTASVSTSQDNDPTSRFVVQVLWADGTRYAYNANSDTAVKKFESEGAMDNMIPYAEIVKGGTGGPTGFGRFNGRIGGGKLTVTMLADDGQQIKADLPIIGGPKFSQGLTGSGTWQMSG